MNGEKMNIQYRKIFNKNYAIISDYNTTDYKECYRSKMLKSNRLNNFLTYDTQNINGSIQFTYDISSKQSIYSFYENSDIDFDMVRHLIMSLKSAFDTLNNYLLEPDFIVLDPKLIYMNIATKSIYFCYCPGERNNFYDSLNSLLCYILSKINHEDTNSIVLAYSLQQQSTNTNYTFDDLLEIINKQIFNQDNAKADFQNSQKKNTADIKNINNPASDCVDFPENMEQSNNFLDKTEQISESNFNKKSVLNKNGLAIIPVCIFFIVLSTVIYLGIFRHLFSLELIIVIGIITFMICFNIFSFLKSRQKQIPTETSKDLNMELFSAPADIPDNILKKEDINIEANFYEDTIILGYRSSENTPRLVYTGTDFISENELNHFPFVIGKMAENVNMIIDNPMISRIHAKIYLKENHYYIEDMNSSNGTYINNNLIQPHTLTEISTGDYITFSHLTYIFQ